MTGMKTGSMAEVFVIPARGGSKRIPRKNVLPFAGVPMIARAIATAREAFPRARIVVSTDDAEIAGTGLAAGAEVPFVRPSELSDDQTGTTAVMAHAVGELGLEPGQAVCCLYATTPLLCPVRLQEGRALISHDCDFSFAAMEFPSAPERGLLVGDDGLVRPAMPDRIGARSQDLRPWLHDAGQFYWGFARNWLSVRQVFLSRARAVVLDRNEVCDIDTPEDWAEAERLFGERSV